MYEKFKAFFHSNSIFLVSLIVVWLVVIGALLMAAQRVSAAETFVGSEEDCIGVAQTAHMMVMQRDQGVSWEQAEPLIIEGMSAAKGSEGSYLRNDDDMRAIYEMAHFIWTDLRLTQDNVAEMMFAACMHERPVDVRNLV